MEDTGKRQMRRFSDFFRHLFRPSDLFSLLSKDRYRSLKIRIIIIDAVLSVVPLIIVVTISYFWFQQILKDDFKDQLKGDIESTKQSVEFFLDERLSALRFIVSSYTFEELRDKKILNAVFVRLKREFPGLVDLGVIDSDGIQQAYAGPYLLEKKNYSTQDWFNKIVIHAHYVSDIFMGYRMIPHFAMAVKNENTERGTFWVLRATIAMETLGKYTAMLNPRGNDDAFIVNREGVIQTPSKFHGNVLEKFGECPLSSEKVSVNDMEDQRGIRNICASAGIRNSPWLLVAVIEAPSYGRIPKIFRNELFFLSVISIFIGIMANVFMTQTVVNRIRHADIEREEAIAKTEHSNKMATVGRLAAGVAHEINNPLAIINEKAGLMEDMLEQSGNLPEQKEKFLNLLGGIFDSINRCRKITHRLLGFSRRVDVGRDVIDMNDAIKEVIGFIEKEVLYRNIRLELNLKKDLPRIETDKGMLQQVFLNIINNAIDAVHEGGLIEVSSDVRGDEVVLVSVRDSGIGIPKDEIRHIFEPFYTTKEKDKGTGLGLSISYGIIQRLGGSILVESEVNKGTTFIVEMPIKAYGA
jgi:two-component system NtrC family sensor kinase